MRPRAREVPPDFASLRIYGSNRRPRVEVESKNDEPSWPGRWPRGFVLELSGNASITRRAELRRLAGRVRIDEVGTGTTGETSYGERTPSRPSTARIGPAARSR